MGTSWSVSLREERRPDTPCSCNHSGSTSGVSATRTRIIWSESGDTGLTGDRREVDENYGSAARRDAGPQRVGEREIVDQPARAWSCTFGE